MKSRYVAVIASLLVLGGAGYWFWSLSAIPFEPRDERIILTVQHGPVEIRSNGQGDWQTIPSSTTLVATDEVRTGQVGRAQIRFFSQAEIRAQGDTEIRIQQADFSGSDGPIIRVGMTHGEAWTNVLPIIQLDGRFAIETPLFSATTRGGSFDVSVTGTSSVIQVSDAAVDIRSIPATTSSTDPAPISIPAGYLMTIGADGKIGSMRPAIEAEHTSAWFAENRRMDKEFLQHVQKVIIARLQYWEVAQPFSWKDTIVGISEQLRQSLFSHQEYRLSAAYVERRIFGIKKLIDAGKSGLALQAMTSLEAYVHDALKRNNSSTYHASLQASLFEVDTLFANTSPTSPLYRLEQRLEDLIQSIAGDEPSVNLNTRLLAIGGRLDLTSHLMTLNALEEAGISIEAARQGVLNAEQELEQGTARLTADQLRALQTVLLALKAREMALQLGLAEALVHPPVSTSGTSTIDGATTSTKPVNVPDPYADIETIMLAAIPNPILKNHLAELRVTATHRDGTITDVTTKVSFRVIGEAGTISGPSFIGVKKGSATIEARLATTSTSLSATTRVQVQEESKLARIDVMPENSPIIKQGQQTGIVVKAYYTDGKTAIVTSRTTWKTSDQNIGTATNGIFSAWIYGKGDVTITGTYSEDGITKSSPLIFTVISAQ